MMKCFICEGNFTFILDYCDDAVQISCCYENFCDKHIKEELMKNFTCPNCNSASTIKDIIPNKKLRECIIWYKSLLKESIKATQDTNLQNTSQNTAPPLQNFNPYVPNAPTTPIMPFQNCYYPNYPLANISQFNVPNQQTVNETDHKSIKLMDEKEMTPEEKMQFYNKLNENESLKKTPDVEETHIEKSLKSVKSEKSSEGKSQMGNIPPLLPGHPGMMSMPMKPEQAMMYYRMNPMFFGGPMPYPYPMYPMPPITEEKIKPKKVKSRSASKESRKEKRKRSKSRSRHKKRDRSRDRDRYHERDRHRNSKDRKDKYKRNKYK